MDTEYPLPAKRSRDSYNGNLQINERVREFKLPRQYPSMIVKLDSNVTNSNNRKRTNNDVTTTCISKSLIKKKITPNQEVATSNVMRKIKLKSKDGRDLGEVNIQHLPQNIKGKTITLTKNGIKESPEIVLAGRNSKGMTLGVLTPVNIVKKQISQSDSSTAITVDVDKSEMVNAAKTGDTTTIVEHKRMSALMDPHGRPQVLMFQSGNNWHMVKLANSTTVNNLQTEKNVTTCKVSALTNGGKMTVVRTKDQMTNLRTEKKQNECDKLLPGDVITSTKQISTIAKRPCRNVARNDTVDRGKTKSTVADNADSKPKIEISRVFAPTGVKSIATAEPVAKTRSIAELPSENEKTQTASACSKQKKPSLRQDEMVFLPSNIPSSLDSDSDVVHSNRTIFGPSSESSSSHDDNSMSAITIENVRSMRDTPSTTATATVTTTKPVTSTGDSTKSITTNPVSDKNDKDEISGNLNILTKALSMVQDQELRAKALKALMDCGIGTERLVPIVPECDKKPIKDSSTQTAVFGLFEPQNFIHVTPNNPAIGRIQPIQRKSLQKVGHIIGNPHSQELSLNNVDLTNWIISDNSSEVTAMVEAYLAENEGTSEVRNIFSNPHPARHKLASSLEEDFQTYKKYDEDGLLNIHRAVVADNVPAVTRHLKVLKACGETPDLPTAGGETSLELAVRYEVSSKTIETLLNYGAEPTSLETGHDSALHIASKKSLSILSDLIPYVNDPKALDNYDSSGFAAVHYCAQNDNRTGIIDLSRASADVNLQDRRSGRTPLFHAIENENIELAKLLLDRGAKPGISTYSGHTIFALLEDGKHYGLTELINRTKSNKAV